MRSPARGFRRTTSFLACIALTLITGRAEGLPRNAIRFPEDCAYEAHEGDQENQSDVCASVVEGIFREGASGPLRARCDSFDPVWPPEVAFIPLGSGRFLLQWRCFVSAYNVGFLYFLYDETSMKPTRRGTQRPAPPLILFPTHPAMQNQPWRRWGVRPHEAIIPMRFTDAKSLVIHALVKGVGDGSYGYYSRYRVDGASALPVLETTVIRNEEDREEPMDFSEFLEPSGKGWVRLPQTSISGCFARLQDPRCPK